ncbi:MAG: tyrosine-type recombinase/integrase [Clostridia bacterium]|nr:tyrosine-type recombinase/integrase [Clostridia bacterium]
MARPVGIRFYEIPLPTNLPPNLQWMHLYHQNCEQLACYLVEHGAGSTARNVALHCLQNLRDFLVTANHGYSSETALRWFEQSDFKNKGALVTLHRLSDLYQYGTVQPIHAFPVALPYCQGLFEVWKNILDDYLSTLLLKPSAITQIRRCISRFFYRMQERGVKCPSEISFIHLETYYREEAHITHNETARYTYNVSDILLFMAEKGMCHHALAWYLFFRMQGRVLHLKELSSDQVQRIDAARTESLNFPAEDFAAVIPDFLKRLENLGYGKTNRNVTKYTLLSLLVFIELHDLGYHPAVAEIWLEKERSRKGGSGWKQNRRILQLFEVYTLEGDIIPQLFFRQKPLLSDGLPDWCKSQLEDFLLQKKREGWESSTIAMYRSCTTRFCLYLCTKGLSSFSEVTAATVTAFNRADKHLSTEGKNAYNVRIRNFLQFLERNGDIPYGIHVALFCIAAKNEKIVVTLTEEELSEMREAHTNCTTPMQLRNKAMVLFGTKMGIRASDIVRIQIQDINWNERTITFVQKKTSHEAKLPMPDDVGNAIFFYLRDGRPKTGSPFLFVRHRAPFTALDRIACVRALKVALPGRNVPRSGFHVTRKTFATGRLRAGTNRQTISELLGQRDTSSLNHYLYLDSERMKQCPIMLSSVNLEMAGDRYGI